MAWIVHIGGWKTITGIVRTRNIHINKAKGELRCVREGTDEEVSIPIADIIHISTLHGESKKHKYYQITFQEKGTQGRYIVFSKSKPVLKTIRGVSFWEIDVGGDLTASNKMLVLKTKAVIQETKK